VKWAQCDKTKSRELQDCSSKCAYDFMTMHSFSTQYKTEQF